eukprot:COSAG02_NODE_1262_length_13556_cov_11.011522_9_plen_84_part_00
MEQSAEQSVEQQSVEEREMSAAAVVVAAAEPVPVVAAPAPTGTVAVPDPRDAPGISTHACALYMYNGLTLWQLTHAGNASQES